MKPRGIALQIFGGLILFVSISSADRKPYRLEIVQKLHEIEDLINKAYGVTPRYSDDADPVIYGRLRNKISHEDDLYNNLIRYGRARGARSANVNANVNINSGDYSEIPARKPLGYHSEKSSRNPLGHYSERPSGHYSERPSGHYSDHSSRNPLRYSSRDRMKHSDEEDSDYGIFGIRERTSKIQRRRPRFTRFRDRALIDNRPGGYLHHKYHHVSYPSSEDFSSNHNILSVKTVRGGYGSRSLGGSQNYNINENYNTHERDENLVRNKGLRNENYDEGFDYE